MQIVARGFSNTSYGNILGREVAEECANPRRQKPAKIQELARLILEQPDHRGLGLALARLRRFTRILMLITNNVGIS